MNETNAVREQLRDKVAETRDNIGDMARLAKEAVVDKVQDLGSRASESYRDGKAKVHDMEQRLVGAVREAPVKSVLIAAGVGLIVALIWRRS